MALAPDTDARIARHWAERLGCSPSAFQEPDVTVTEHDDEGTIRLVRRGNALVVAAPAGLRDELGGHSEAIFDADLPATDAVERALVDTATAVGGVHGPYALWYVDRSGFSPAESDARLLVGADEQAFERLRKRVPETDWARASPTFRPGQTAGLFEDGRLVAVATLTHLPFPDVGVVVDPERRGRGYGRAVVSKITAAAFDADVDAVVRYRTPASETASLSLAESLGFDRWARSAVLVLDRAQNGSP